MIASASWQFERRKVIRETWATQLGDGSRNLKYIFFIGNDGKRENVAKLADEFEQHGDIIEEDFQENYYNLTLKTIGQLKWATHFCPNMKYGLHIDDDVFGQGEPQKSVKLKVFLTSQFFVTWNWMMKNFTYEK